MLTEAEKAELEKMRAESDERREHMELSARLLRLIREADLETLRRYARLLDQGDILQRLVDAVAGEQEDPIELERALGREAPAVIAEARAVLSGARRA